MLFIWYVTRGFQHKDSQTLELTREVAETVSSVVEAAVGGKDKHPQLWGSRVVRRVIQTVAAIE